VTTGPLPERRPEAPPSATGAASANVLVVEDNKPSAESMVMLLELYGHKVRVAENGRAALDAIARERPDLMLIDIGLPRMDGYELARRIRRQKAGRRLKLVALTGFGRDEDRQRALDAGFDVHLVKPVNIDELKRLIASVAAVPDGDRAESADSSE
jgi:CheY-like chemotaxis protein